MVFPISFSLSFPDYPVRISFHNSFAILYYKVKVSLKKKALVEQTCKLKSQLGRKAVLVSDAIGILYPNKIMNRIATRVAHVSINTEICIACTLRVRSTVWPSCYKTAAYQTE